MDKISKGAYYVRTRLERGKFVHTLMSPDHKPLLFVSNQYPSGGQMIRECKIQANKELKSEQ